MLRIWFTFYLFCVVSLYADATIESLKNRCLSANTEISTENEFQRLTGRLEFQKAKEYCDNLTSDPSNCKATSRFWLGVDAFAEGEFEKAENLFREGLELKARYGKNKNWISHKVGVSGWGNPEDMIQYIQRSKSLEPFETEYSQNVTYLIIDNTDTSANLTAGKKVVTKKMDPCLALHGYLSLKVLRKYIELFSNGKLTLKINSIYVTQTGTKLDGKNYLILDSLTPWDEGFSKQMNAIITESDLIFLSFPRDGGNALASMGEVNVVQNILYSPSRNLIRMPSEWLSMINFPQIFHEYMHTVEFNMNRNGMENFHATSHGADAKLVEALTGLNSDTTGESDWADYFFQNTIPTLADDIKSKSNANGWEKIFGIHKSKKNFISDITIKKLYEEIAESGSESLLTRQKEAGSLMSTAYTSFNRESNPGKAANIAVSSYLKFPFDPTFYRKAKWFVEHSRLNLKEKSDLIERLNETAKIYGIDILNLRQEDF